MMRGAVCLLCVGVIISVVHVRADNGGGNHIIAGTDYGSATGGTPIRLGVLGNDDVPAAKAGVCISRASAAPAPERREVRFVDVAAEAGVRGTVPQKIVKTSPNCIFDQWDAHRGVWDRASFCMPEILTGGASTGDYDGDGLPDIYVTRLDAVDSLYRNLGNGSFADVTLEAGLGVTRRIRSNAAAWLDVDNDGDADLFISTLGDKRFYLFINDGTGRFTEEAVERGADLTRPAVPASEGGLTSSFSIAVGDYDGDGWLDIYTTEWFPRLNLPEAMTDPETASNMVTCKLLRNRGGEGADYAGHFVDVTWSSGLRVKIGGISGNPDDHMNIEKWWSPEVQARNRKILLSLGVPPSEVEWRMARLNDEADGMFLREAQRGDMLSEVYQRIESDRYNLKEGKHSAPFHFMSFMHRGAFQFGAQFVDLNGDGAPELIVSGDFGTTQLYWNNRNGTFTPGPLHLLWDHFDNSMGASIGDVNGDGLLDVLFTSMALKAPQRLNLDKFYPNAGISSNFEGNHLYLNEGNRIFLDVTNHAGVKDTGWSWGGVLFDMDNDGWLDIAISNGMDDPETTDDDFAVNTPNAAFRNTGPKGNFTFTAVGPSIGLADRRDGRGYFEIDYDGDGDLDLFLVNHADFPALYRNDGGNSLGYIRVAVKEASCLLPSDAAAAAGSGTGSGTGSKAAAPTASTASTAAGCVPRDSLGARVYLQAAPGAREFVREIGSAAAFMAQSEHVAHFGLGAGRAMVHRLRVVWPARNATKIIYNVPARAELVVRAPAEHNVVEEFRYAEEEDAGASPLPTVPDCAAVQLRVQSIAQQPTHGRAEVDATGRFVTYRADPGYVGEDSFTYRVVDGAGHAGEGSVRVRVRSSRQGKGNAAAHASAAAASDDSAELSKDAILVVSDELGVSATTASESVAYALREQESLLLPLPSGRLNNLQRPHYGTAGTPLIRLALPDYAEPTGATMGGAGKLPSARAVSNALFAQRAPLPSAEGLSQLFTAFAAFLQHDLVNSYQLQNVRRASDGTDAGDNIAVPVGDPQWDPDNQGGIAMPYRRDLYHLSPSTSGATTHGRYRQQLSTCSHFMDLHTVHGSNGARAEGLLQLDSSVLGCLRMRYEGGGAAVEVVQQAAESQSPADTAALLLPLLKDALLPANDKAAISMVDGYAKAGGRGRRTLAAAGDERANLFPGLLALHTVFAREHNRIALTLGVDEHLREQVFSYFDTLDAAAVLPNGAGAGSGSSSGGSGGGIALGDRAYHAAAAVARAKYQAIVWYEFLPALLGPAEYARLPPYAGYNSSVDPSVSNEFATVAASFWHSQLGSDVPRYDSEWNEDAFPRLALRDAWFATHRVHSEGGPDAVLRGAWATAAQETDVLFVDDVRTMFVGANTLGLDLAALDLHRGRDHGLPRYNALRQSLGLAAVTSFEEVVAGLPARAAARVAARLAGLYSSVDELELMVGGLLEAHVPGGAVGPTFAALWREQMVRSRDGDRFWFENAHSALAPLLNILTDSGIQGLRSTRLAGVLAAVTHIKASAAELSSGPSATAASSSSTPATPGSGKRSGSVFYVRQTAAV